MVLISRHGEGTSGAPTSLSSTAAGCSRPSCPRKSCCTGVPASMTMCTVPMLLEYMKISGTDSHRCIGDRKSVVYGKSVTVRVDSGGRRIIKKKTKYHKNHK